MCSNYKNIEITFLSWQFFPPFGQQATFVHRCHCFGHLLSSVSSFSSSSLSFLLLLSLSSFCYRSIFFLWMIPDDFRLQRNDAIAWHRQPLDLGRHVRKSTEFQWWLASGKVAKRQPIRLRVETELATYGWKPLRLTCFGLRYLNYYVLLNYKLS